jgi:hypothetical protein
VSRFFLQKTQYIVDIIFTYTKKGKKWKNKKGEKLKFFSIRENVCREIFLKIFAEMKNAFGFLRRESILNFGLSFEINRPN